MVGSVVIDSNIIVSILLGSRSLSVIYSSFKEGNFDLVICSELLKELASVLYRPSLNINPADIKELFRIIKTKAIRVEIPEPFVNVCRDPKDNFILELALLSKAEFIVTSDKDLLVLRSFKNTSILSPKVFIKILKSNN